jgi:glycosyltransferase involved in cell wall biosynthesis
MLKIGIYDRYLNTFGGGERYSCKMAEILSKKIPGAEVDLITDIHSNLKEVSERLNLELSKVTLKIFPFISEDYASRITSEYDIFINTTYLSSLPASAKHNIYLCYFPTPFNTDFKLIHKLLLLFFRKPAIWLFKIASGMIESSSFMEVKEGLYDVKRFMLKRGSWSSGRVLFKIKDFSLKNIYLGKLCLGFKNPSSSQINEMNISVQVFPSGKEGFNLNEENINFEKKNENKLVFEKKFILKADEKINLEIPLSAESSNMVLITSDTFIPSEINKDVMDSRKLGAVVYECNKTSLLRKIVLKILGFIPLFLVTYPVKLKFLDSYQEILSISRYSESWVKKLWGKESTILFPPVDTENFYSSAKEKMILSVGRFFPEHHNKKQLELAKVFISLCEQHPAEMKGYELVLAGGLENRKTHLEYVEKITELSKGYPIKIIPNISWNDLLETFAKAEIFWHASGFGEDENKHPEKFEHFGITTVEAMAAGCIPVVINKGGQMEIIKEAENGFKFEDFNELKEKTLWAIKNPEKLSSMRENAKKDSKLFSNEVFEKKLLEIISNARLVLKSKSGKENT